MKAFSVLPFLLWASDAWAQAPSPPTADLGGATGWLAAAVVAMVVALWAVHWSIFGRK